MTLKKLAIVILVFISQNAFGQLDTFKVSLSLDTLQTLITRVDSIQYAAESEFDSVTYSYQQTASRIQNLSTGYQHAIDSLTHLNLPKEKYTQKLDSLHGILQNAAQSAEAQIQSLKQEVKEKLSELPLPPELQSNVAQVTDALDKFKFPSLPSDFDTQNLSSLNTNVDGLVANVDLSQMQDLPSAEGLGNLTDNIHDVIGVTGDVTSQTGDIVNSVQQPGQIDKLAKDQLSQFDAVKSLQEGQGILPVNGIPSEEETKQQLVQQVQELAVDHFAGKQEVLQAAIDKMAKYKGKYENAPSIGDLPKRVPNAMRGKPFIQRLVPGITLQFQVNHDWMMDTYISAGYRVSGKITAGVGWNQRIAYNFDNGKFNSQAKIYGLRNYGEFRFKKGFIARGEVEWMNAFIPPLSNSPVDIGQRDWVFGVLTGIKKEYKFLRTVKGNVQIMYNIWDPHDKSPYTNRLNVRMGFEFLLKKKTKKADTR